MRIKTSNKKNFADRGAHPEYPLPALVSKIVITDGARPEAVRWLEGWGMAPDLVQHKHGRLK